MKNIQTKPKIYVDFDSPDGNIFTILAHAENAMKVYSIINAKEKASEMRDRVTKSESYEDALEVFTYLIDLVR